MTPLQTLFQEELIDAAAFDRDPFLFVEVSLEPIECPAAKGQTQTLGIGQGGGDHLSPLLRGVGVRPTRAGAILKAVQSLRVEAMNPEVDCRPADAEVLGNLTGPLPLGEGQEHLGPLDEARLGGP
jgi:hypothetical protein